MKKIIGLSACFVALTLAGCSNEPELGVALNQLQQEQTLNSNAWYENINYLPEGSGERTQNSLGVYNNNGEKKKN